MKNLLSYSTMTSFAILMTVFEVAGVGFVDFMSLTSDSIAWEIPFGMFCALNALLIIFLCIMWWIVIYDALETRRVRRYALTMWAMRRAATANNA